MKKQIYILIFSISAIGFILISLLFEDSEVAFTDKQGDEPNLPILFSADSGFYSDSFYLTLNTDNKKYKIRYTLDSSDPDFASDVYTAPIFIGPNAELNSENSSNKLPGATIVKACCFLGEIRVSEIAVNTYFIDERGYERYSLPVISLIGDPDDLFSKKSGICVDGEVYDFMSEIKDISSQEKKTIANYFQKGDEWERECNFEFFEEGELKYEQKHGMKIFGGASRNEAKKSFTLMTEGYCDSDIEYAFFEDLYNVYGDPINSFGEIVLRNGGSLATRFSCIDSINSEIAGKFLDTQASRAVIVFINGAYNGIYNIRESLSEDYIERHYGIDKNDFEMIETLKTDMQEEFSGYYLSLIEFAEKNDLSLEKNYNYINSKIDLENMIEYFVFNMYIGNTDWPAANNKIWRVHNSSTDYETEKADGKYRYVLYDTDAGMNKLGDFRFDDLHPTIFHWVLENNYPLYKENNVKSLIIFDALIENTAFRNRFINKFCDRANVDYAPNIFIDKAKSWHDLLKPEIENNINRFHLWGGDPEYWDQLCSDYEAYVIQRNEKVLAELAEYFEHNIVRLNVMACQGGCININGNINIAEEKDFHGKYVSAVPINLTAIPDDGYIFEKWSDGCLTAERTIVFDDEDCEKTFHAIFRKDD